MSIIIVGYMIYKAYELKNREYINEIKEEKEKRKLRIKKLDVNVNFIIKKGKKRKYINSLIDEIPELSYYEAAQLKKKLGDIYSEWNEE